MFAAAVLHMVLMSIEIEKERERDVQGSKFMVFQLSLLAFFNAQFNNHHMSFLFIFI